MLAAVVHLLWMLNRICLYADPNAAGQAYSDEKGPPGYPQQPPQQQAPYPTQPYPQQAAAYPPQQQMTTYPPQQAAAYPQAGYQPAYPAPGPVLTSESSVEC